MRQFVVNFKRLQSVGSKKIKENIFKEEDGIWALSCSLTPFSSFKMCNLQKNIFRLEKMDAMQKTSEATEPHPLPIFTNGSSMFVLYLNSLDCNL